MHDSFDMEDEDLLSDIVDEEESPPIMRAIKDDFQPWHLPRKQFVRINQWIKLIDRNKNKLIADDSNLNYLSLPGDDLLDLRVIHDEFCVKNNVVLKFLGFNKFPKDTSHPRNYDINLSLVEVKEKLLVDNNSKVMNYDINQIGVKGSAAHIEASKKGPYDVINLDFCDSIFNKRSAGRNTPALLSEIIFIQSARRNPWLMFITTRIGEKYCDRSIVDILMACFKENLAHKEFSDKAKEKFGCDDFDSFEKLMDEHEMHANLTLISLLKWLLTCCFNYSPKCKIELSSTISYFVEKDSSGFDMVSFALLFTPVIRRPHDKFQLVTQESEGESLTEPAIAADFIDRVLSRKDCDAILKENESTRKSMVAQTVELLSKARYNIDEYDVWLRGHFSSDVR